jgi:endonuclease/exonuclease/phosphatase family metal-dependent hydrolase
VYQRKLAVLSETLLALSPDVVALQEVGSPEAIADLQHALRGEYPHATLSDRPDPRGIRVAFLSKLHLDEVEQIVSAPNDGASRMRRGALRIGVHVGRHRVSLINAHFKSKLLSYPGPGGGTVFKTDDEDLRARVASRALAERAAEAVILRAVATARLSNALHDSLILLGDLNDTPEAATSQILLGPPGSQPNTRGFDFPDTGDTARLFNLAPLIPPERRYSRINSGVPELIDQILVSHHLVPVGHDGRRLLPSVDSHIDRFGKHASVGVDPRERAGEEAPDHAPVTAEFDVMRISKSE